MKTKMLTSLLFVVLAAGSGLPASGPLATNEPTIAALAKATHFHGIAVDASDPSRLYLATHHGLYLIGADGTARQVSMTRDDFMGFMPDPNDPLKLYASGHPSNGVGNLGFVISSDRGASWARLSNGVGGPVDFHQMDVSKANPKVIYGAYNGLQKSTDGGLTWQRVGPAPQHLIALAASSKDENTIYAAIHQGLLVSLDGGRNWRAAHPSRRPATTVHVAPDGTVHAYLVGVGLIRGMEPELNWQTVSSSFGDGFLLYLAVDPNGGQALYTVTNSENDAQALLTSRDGGRTWSPFGN